MKLPLRAERYIRLSPGLYLYAAVVILLLPLRWVLAAFMAAGIHEVCHLAAIRLLGIEVYSVQIGITGAKITTEPMNDRQELLCALAGPIGGFLSIFFARWAPHTALCAVFQSAYNLLPVYPLDGGRALRCGIKLLLKSQLAERLCSCIETVVSAGLVVIGIYGTFWLHLGPVPVLAGIGMLFKTIMSDEYRK